LKIALEKRPEMPFIFVSGTLDEKVAIEALEIGAMPDGAVKYVKSGRSSSDKRAAAPVSRYWAIAFNCSNWC